MYLLRQTWSNDIFPASKLYMLDVKAHRIDGNWPIAPVPKPAIHVNPNFLKTKVNYTKLCTAIRSLYFKLYIFAAR